MHAILKQICTTMYMYNYVRVLGVFIFISTYLTIDVNIIIFMDVKAHLYTCIPTCIRMHAECRK